MVNQQTEVITNYTITTCKHACKMFQYKTKEVNPNNRIQLPKQKVLIINSMLKMLKGCRDHM